MQKRNQLKTEIENSLAGDRVAFGRLVRQHAAIVTGVAFSVCGNLAASEDIGQEAFTEAWRNLSTLKTPEKFTAWLCTIARRRAVDWVRRRKPNQSLDSFPFDIPDTKTQTGESNMISKQHRDLVWSLLESLPQTHRETLVLFYRGQQSIREVASALDTTEAAVRQRLKRGRQMIREEMTETVREALCDTAPTPSYSAAIVASLPALSVAAGAAAPSAAASAIATKSVGLAAGPAVGMAGAILGPLLGIAGGVIGTWNSWRNCEYESQQRLIIRSSTSFMIGLTIFFLLLFALLGFRVYGWIPNHALYAGSLISLIAIFQVLNLYWIASGIRVYKRVGEQSREKGEPVREAVQAKAEALAIQTRVVDVQGKVGYEAFRWNAAAWFGGGIGASVWMLLTGVLSIAANNATVGYISLACFLTISSVTLTLWICRQKVNAFLAYQILFGILGILVAVMLATIQFGANQELQTKLSWSPWAWALLAIFPALILQFTYIRRNFEKRMLAREFET